MLRLEILVYALRLVMLLVFQTLEEKCVADFATFQRLSLSNPMLRWIILILQPGRQM